MSKKRILVLNDTHVGSIWGLWPPGHEPREPTDKQEIAGVELRGHLYNSWTQCQKELMKKRYNAVIFLGDIIDGPSPSREGRDLTVQDLQKQVNAAAEIFNPFLQKIKPKETYVLSGTDYHSSNLQENEEGFAQKINAEYVGAGPFDFPVEETVINFSHGEGGTYWYRGAKLDRIGFAMLLCIASEPIYNARHIVRGHYHFEAHLHYRHQDIYVSPCWQAQTDYMRKKDPFKMIPNIGCLELIVEGEKVTPRFYSYPHPPRPKYPIRGVSSWPKKVSPKYSEEAEKVLKEVKAW